jgi:hypothetical protein
MDKANIAAQAPPETRASTRRSYFALFNFDNRTSVGRRTAQYLVHRCRKSMSNHKMYRLVMESGL